MAMVYRPVCLAAVCNTYLPSARPLFCPSRLARIGLTVTLYLIAKRNLSIAHEAGGPSAPVPGVLALVDGMCRFLVADLPGLDRTVGTT